MGNKPSHQICSCGRGGTFEAVKLSHTHLTLDNLFVPKCFKFGISGRRSGRLITDRSLFYFKTKEN